jgi:hypothetical protein
MSFVIMAGDDIFDGEIYYDLQSAKDAIQTLYEEEEDVSVLEIYELSLKYKAKEPPKSTVIFLEVKDKIHGKD